MPRKLLEVLRVTNLECLSWIPHVEGLRLKLDLFSDSQLTPSFRD